MSTPDTLTRELAALDDALAGRPVDPDLADLAELAVALRDERLAPDPAFTRTLDSRVERGFPRAAKARKRLGIKWPRVTLPALGVAASVLLVVGIAVTVPKGGDDRSASSAGGSSGGTAATEQASPSDSGSEPSVAAKRAPSTGGGSATSDSASRPTPATSAPRSAIAPLPTPPLPTPPPPDAAAPTAAATASSSARPSSCWRRRRARSIALPPRSCASPTTSAATWSPRRSPRTRAGSSSCGCPSGGCRPR